MTLFLDAEMKQLHGLGLGTHSKRAEPISPDEEALLWTSGQLGTHNGKAFTEYSIITTIGLCEHRNLKCSQYERKVDEQ